MLAHARSALQQWAADPGAAPWLGYLSSTSVYGDWQGAWVEERCAKMYGRRALRPADCTLQAAQLAWDAVFLPRSELRAASGKGLARRHAEAEWLALREGLALPVHIFRLGGAALLGF